MVGIRDTQMVLCPIDQAVKGKTDIDKELIRVSDIMTT
jgi:6-phosphofructokinase 1